jgi:hypothetical protein
MSSRKVLISVAAILILAVLATGCGQGGNGPGGKEIGAPVYPGAEYEGTGTLKSTFKFASEDPCEKIVDWYRKELKDKSGFSETNTIKSATTGDTLNYKEGGKSYWITVLPGIGTSQTKLEISVNKSMDAPQ